MTFNLILVLVLGAVCYIILPFVVWCLNGEKLKKILTIVLFCLYLVVLFAGVFGQIDISKDRVSITLDFSGKWFAKTINWSLSKVTTFDLIINLVMLFPVGMMVLYFARNKKWWVKVLLLIVIGLCSGAFIEFFQFMLPIQRSVQLSDVLLNTVSVSVGGLIAWGYLEIIKQVKKPKNKS